MPRRFRERVFGYMRRIVALALSVLCLAPAVHTQDTVRLANGEWPPYLGKDLQHYGVASRIVTEAFARGGIKVVYGFFPWPRSMMLAQNGTWDGTLVWFSNSERRLKFFVSEPVIMSTYVFFHLRDKPFDWQAVEDLRGLLIGATTDYDYGESFQNAEKRGLIKVERVPTDEMNLRKLLHGRIDIFPIDRDVGMNMIRKHFSPEDQARIVYHQRPVRSDSLCLLLSRKVPENRGRLAVFNAKLVQLKEQGLIDQYLTESRRNLP